MATNSGISETHPLSPPITQTPQYSEVDCKTYKMKKSKYGFSIVKDDEALLLMQSAFENNDGDPKEALQDVKMIDHLLHATRLHIITGHNIRRTAAGYLRKGTSLYDTYNSIIGARAGGIEM